MNVTTLSQKRSSVLLAGRTEPGLEKRAGAGFSNNIVAHPNQFEVKSSIKSGIPILTESGKTIGYLRDGGILHRKAPASKSILKSPPCICFEAAALKSAIRQGCKSILFEDSESGKTYNTDVMNYYLHPIPVNRGWGDQIGVALEHWQIFDPAHPETQPSLFEVQP